MCVYSFRAKREPEIEAPSVWRWIGTPGISKHARTYRGGLEQASRTPLKACGIHIGVDTAWWDAL